MSQDGHAPWCIFRIPQPDDLPVGLGLRGSDIRKYPLEVMSKLVHANDLYEGLRGHYSRVYDTRLAESTEKDDKEFLKAIADDAGLLLALFAPDGIFDFLDIEESKAVQHAYAPALAMARAIYTAYKDGWSPKPCIALHYLTCEGCDGVHDLTPFYEPHACAGGWQFRGFRSRTSRMMDHELEPIGPGFTAALIDSPEDSEEVRQTRTVLKQLNDLRPKLPILENQVGTTTLAWNSLNDLGNQFNKKVYKAWKDQHLAETGTWVRNDTEAAEAAAGILREFCRVLNLVSSEDALYITSLHRHFLATSVKLLTNFCSTTTPIKRLTKMEYPSSGSADKPDGEPRIGTTMKEAADIFEECLKDLRKAAEEAKNLPLIAPQFSVDTRANDSDDSVIE